MAKKTDVAEAQISEEVQAVSVEVVSEPLQETLHSLEDLALSYRTSGWQQAALLRLMDWTPDRLVSEADYDAALVRLSSRPLSGGRE